MPQTMEAFPEQHELRQTWPDVGAVIRQLREMLHGMIERDRRAGDKRESTDARKSKKSSVSAKPSPPKATKRREGRAK